MLTFNNNMYALQGDSGAEDAAFVAEGFPRSVCQAFQATANTTKAVVMSRVPGGSCMTLINEGYDLKGFFIKAKSCNWGPMAGFLCQLPPFNKSGTANEQMEKNAKENAKTFKLYNHIQDELKKQVPDDAKEKDLVTQTAPVPFQSSCTPFVHLKISDANKASLASQTNLVCIRQSADEVYGVAWSKNETVCMEFYLLKEADNLWGLYHGDVFTKRDDGNWEDFLASPDGKKFFPYFDQVADVESTLSRILAKMRAETGDSAYQARDRASIGLLQDKSSGAPKGAQVSPASLPPGFPSGRGPFYPILGIKNPYPPYRNDGTANTGSVVKGDGTAGTVDGDTRSNYYKNAVTGDYDLFAVWPRLSDAGMSGPGIIRISEKGKKQFCVDVNQACVDVVPSFSALGESEDPRWGNASDNVLLVAGTLNSFMDAMRNAPRPSSIWARVCSYISCMGTRSLPSTFPKNASPNLAFHSDEGGRPGLTELELPVAVFVPQGEIQDATRITQFLRCIVTERAKVLGLIKLQKATYKIVMHAAWLYDLIDKSETDGTVDTMKAVFGIDPTKATPDSRKTFKACLDGNRGSTIEEDLTAIRGVVTSLSTAPKS